MWMVIRQDDNGRGFVMADHLSEDEAQLLVTKFTARGHKQTYLALGYANSRQRYSLFRNYGLDI